MEAFNNANMISHIGGAIHGIVFGERFNTATVTTQPSLLTSVLSTLTSD